MELEHREQLLLAVMAARVGDARAPSPSPSANSRREKKLVPLSKYNKQFGGKKGSAEKAHSAMVSEYGPEKGEQVFYATKNKRKKKFTKPAK